MKKALKITLVCALALFLLAGCAAAPASSAESVAAAPSSTETALSAALSDAGPDTTVSKRDASGEYDASEAAALAPDDDLTITEAGTYILSGKAHDRWLFQRLKRDTGATVPVRPFCVPARSPAPAAGAFFRCWP